MNIKKEDRLMYACSGAADVGEIADKAVRKLRAKGVGMMSCLAALGADLQNYVKTAKEMPQVVTVDGCPMLCARKNVERIGVKPVSFVLTDMGLEKGKTPPTELIMQEIATKIEMELK